MHRLQHPPVHGDDSLNQSHMPRLQYAAGGSPDQEEHDEKHIACRRIHSLDNPSDRHGIRLSDNSRQMLYYVPPMAIPR